LLLQLLLQLKEVLLAQLGLAGRRILLALEHPVDVKVLIDN
jgi:hypothetical protein